MTVPDDIRTETPPASESENLPPSRTPGKPMKEVGPESEVRGGPEAPDDEEIIRRP